MLRPIKHFLLIHIPMHTCIYINIFMCELYRCMQACIYFLRLTIHGRVSVYIEASGRFQYSPSFELTFSISQCHFWKIDLWPIVNGGSGSKGVLGREAGGVWLAKKKPIKCLLPLSVWPTSAPLSLCLLWFRPYIFPLKALSHRQPQPKLLNNQAYRSVFNNPLSPGIA